MLLCGGGSVRERNKRKKDKSEWHLSNPFTGDKEAIVPVNSPDDELTPIPEDELALPEDNSTGDKGFLPKDESAPAHPLPPQALSELNSFVSLPVSCQPTAYAATPNENGTE